MEYWKRTIHRQIFESLCFKITESTKDNIEFQAAKYLNKVNPKRYKWVNQSHLGHFELYDSVNGESLYLLVFKRK